MVQLWSLCLQRSLANSLSFVVFSPCSSDLRDRLQLPSSHIWEQNHVLTTMTIEGTPWQNLHDSGFILYTYPLLHHSGRNPLIMYYAYSRLITSMFPHSNGNIFSKYTVWRKCSEKGGTQGRRQMSLKQCSSPPRTRLPTFQNNTLGLSQNWTRKKMKQHLHSLMTIYSSKNMFSCMELILYQKMTMNYWATCFHLQGTIIQVCVTMPHFNKHLFSKYFSLKMSNMYVRYLFSFLKCFIYSLIIYAIYFDSIHSSPPVSQRSSPISLPTQCHVLSHFKKSKTKYGVQFVLADYFRAWS